MFFNVSLIAHKGINIFFDLQILVRIFLFNLSFGASRTSFYPSLILRLSFAQPSLKRILNFELAHKSFLKKILLFLKYLVSLQQ